MDTLDKLKVLREEREEKDRIQKEKIARLIETKSDFV
jgi:hypothetical protein